MEKKIQIKGNECPVARSLEIIGDRWTLLILRDMFKKKMKHFQEFLSADEKISPNLLSNRLKKLTEYGIIENKLYSEHPPRYEYTLTPLGRELGPVLQSLWDFGKKFTQS